MKKALLFLGILVSFHLFAQETHPPFWEDIQHFRQQDSSQAPPTHAILFVGSSSFTKWTDVQHYFPGYRIINRGFGGSTLEDVIRYEKEVIFNYKPKQIVIYCGENDLAASDTVTAMTVYQRFKKLFSDIRSRFPGIPLVYVSMKPSPSRWNLRNKMIDGNNLIAAYLKKQHHAKFISVWKPMLGSDGKPKPDIYIEDHLHMNARGYAIWQKLIQPALIK
ncbi:MAG: GDSL-type esterase/lipase family protein [Flavisolibacter sp.]